MRGMRPGIEKGVRSGRFATGGRARNVLLSEAFTLSLQREAEDADSVLRERRCNDSVNASLSGAFESGVPLWVRQGVRSNAAAMDDNEGTRRIAGAAEQAVVADGHA